MRLNFFFVLKISDLASVNLLTHTLHHILFPGCNCSSLDFGML